MGRRAKAKGDSLESVFREKRPLLHALARKAGDEEAEDVVQDAFLKSVETEQSSPLKSAVAFMVSVTRHSVIDRLRSRRFRSGVVSEAPDAMFDAIDPAPDPERAAIAADRLARTLAVIENLPLRRREVLYLHRFEGLSYAEIGKRLGISSRTAEGHLAAAMAQLARELDQKDSDAD